MKRIYQFSLRFVQIISLLLIAFLFIGAFLVTCYADNMETQQVLTRCDSILWNTVGIAAFLLFLSGCAYIACRRKGCCRKALLLLTFGWFLLSGATMILFSKTVPAADAMSVYSAAERLAAGDTSVIHPTDSYLSYYPQQVGLMAFLELLIRIWNVFGSHMPAYHFIKGIYVILLCIAVFFQYRTVHLMWQDAITDCLYLVFSACNLPLLMYTSFIYGEIPSFAAFCIGCYFLLKILMRKKTNPVSVAAEDMPSQASSLSRWRLFAYSAGCVLFLSLSVMLRKNSMILIIAVLLILVLESLRSRRYGLLLLAICCCICSFSILPAVQKGYELRSHSTLSSGVPAMSYFAMGMQEASRGNGWYNGFNINTYESTGMNTALTNEISRQAIRDRLLYFKEHPGYTADFYLHKHLSQWADGTYASRQATLATFGGRSSFFRELYEGTWSAAYISWCNAYQNVVYLGSLLFCLIPFLPRLRRNTNASPVPYLGLIGVLGGFLFHIIWEANSRYIFTYSLLLLPYAARGICLLLHSFRFRLRRRSSASTK